MKSLTDIQMLKLTSESILVLFITTVDQCVGVSSSSIKNTLMKVEDIKMRCLLFGHCTLLFFTVLCIFCFIFMLAS